MRINFKTAFVDSAGREIAGTWFEAENGSWRVSTVPIRWFATEDEAIAFFQSHCDPESGLMRIGIGAQKLRARSGGAGSD